jgi:hypothetical protein
MMRVRRALVIATLSLLAWAATASADCAWVLWTYTLARHPDVEEYAVTSAHSTRGECEQDVRDWAPVLKSSGYKVTGGVQGTRELHATKEGVRTRYFCLPDSVDPRAPKGK